MTYYGDSDKITFDKAEQLVRRYLREYSSRRVRVTCRDVASAYEVDESHHNLIRLNKALNSELEVVRASGAKATQYRISESGGIPKVDSEEEDEQCHD